MPLGNFLNLFLQQSHLLGSNFDNCERQNTIAAVLRWQCRKCANQGGYRSRKKLGLQWLSSKQCQTRVADCRLLLWPVNYFRTFLGLVIAWQGPCGVSNLDIIVHLLLCWELHATIYTLFEKRAWYFVENYQQIVSLCQEKWKWQAEPKGPRIGIALNRDVVALILGGVFFEPSDVNKVQRRPIKVSETRPLSENSDLHRGAKGKMVQWRCRQNLNCFITK